MVKFYSPHKKKLDVKIGFRSIIEAKRASKYLGKNEEHPINLSLEISTDQQKVLDDNYISYYQID